MGEAYSSEFPFSSFSFGGLLPNTSNCPINLPELLIKAAEKSGENDLIYLDHQGITTYQSYQTLLNHSEKVLSGLRQQGGAAGTYLILLLEDNQDILTAFWGAILGGLIPIIIEAPPPNQRVHPVFEEINQLQNLLETSLIIISKKRWDLVESLPKKSAQSSSVVIFEELINYAPSNSYHVPQSEDTALLVLTSGSTGSPKCIELSHGNLVNRAKGTQLLNQQTKDTIALNWLPFNHIGSISDWHIRCLLLGCQSIYVQKEWVLARILNWLDVIDRFRVTQSWAPTFAYNLINEQLLIQENQTKSWDLSCLNWLLTAGEMITPDVIKKFQQLLEPYGFKKTAICSAFGMAELGSGITYSQQKEGSLTFYRLGNDNRIDRLTSEQSQLENSPCFADLGLPIPGVTLRIVDENNQPLPEEKIGYLQVKGDPVFRGYYQNVAANQGVFSVDGWFQTGDLGFLRQGHLVITGRAKNMMIVNGVNYYSHEIEAIVEQVEGINVSYTAACAVKDNQESAEKTAIFFNCQLDNQEVLKKLIKAVRYEVVTQAGLNPDYLIPLPPKRIPKTTIGKIKYSQLQKQFSAGEFRDIVEKINQLFRPIKIVTQAEIELEITKIWKTLLTQETINEEDNFFEIGGQSFLLIQVQRLLEEELGYRISITDLFRYPTIKSLAKHLDQKQKPPIKTKQQPPTKKTVKSRDIAVIGMACRFPGADNLEQFWENLCQGVESISFLTEDTIIAAGFPPKLVKNPNYVKASSVINHVEDFDADFFGYTAKEAELLDPQHRVLLECAWESLENAGYNPLAYAGEIALYAGAGMNTYLLNNLYPNRQHLDDTESPDVIDLDALGGFQLMVTNDKDYLTTRISYKLNLTGPSVNVQTACSTSLTAIHLACQSLRNGECDLALAGGVSIQVPQNSGYLYQEGMILSPDGHCRAFDAQAQGTIFGNGVGLVVLKDLESALEDGDHIYAVIKGTAISNDGSNKVNYLAPNGEGQSRAVAQALLAAEVSAENISYVEAHGTGTTLGDPIEVNALDEAFRLTTDKVNYCALGSVKTNIGHMQIASGVAGFIKTVLALYHQKIPATLHFEQANPQIDFEQSPFYVNSHLQNWETSGEQPRLAGVNSLGIGGTNVHVILQEAPAAKKLEQPPLERPLHLLTLSGKNKATLRQIVALYQDYLAQHPESSWADICFSANTGRVQLPYRIAIAATSIEEAQTQLKSAIIPTQIPQQKPKIAFFFSNQPWMNLGKELYHTQPTFRHLINEGSQLMGIDPLTLVEGKTKTDQFILKYGFFHLWQSWGIQISAVMGEEGLGELIAACVAGVFSLEEGLKLLSDIPSNAATTETVRQDVPYHWPELNLISNQTGQWATEAIMTPNYWGQQNNRTLPVVTAITTLEQAGYNTLILEQNFDGSPSSPENRPQLPEIHCLPSFEGTISHWQTIIDLIRELYEQGADINWQAFEQDYPRYRQSLPTYPFQRQRYWIEPPSVKSKKLTFESSEHPLLGEKIPLASSEVVFQSSLNLEHFPWLKEHKINQLAILPGSAYLEMALAAGQEVLNSTDISLETVSIAQALVLEPQSTVTVQVIIRKNPLGASFEIYSKKEDIATEWTKHCQGKITNNVPELPLKAIDIGNLTATLNQELEGERFYQKCRQQRLEYGPNFQGIKTINYQDEEAIAEIKVKPTLLEKNYQNHPCVLDACLQAVFALFPPQTYVPISLDRLTVYRPLSHHLWSYVRLTSPSKESKTLTTDLELIDINGNVYAKIEGLTSQKLAEQSGQDPVYGIEWEQQAAIGNFAINQTPGRWLIVSDEPVIGEDLSKLLAANHQVCQLIQTSEDSLDLGQQYQQFQAELERQENQIIPLKGVITLWSSELTSMVEEQLTENCQRLLGLMQQLIVDKSNQKLPQLWIVTRGTQTLESRHPHISTISNTVLWAMAKVIQLEYPDLNCVCLDLDSQSSPKDAQKIWTELESTGQEKQVAWRGENRYVARLRPLKLGDQQPQRLAIAQKGLLDSLTWQPSSRRPPQPDEVELKIQATGLNFRDLLTVLGFELGENPVLGLEAVGEVVTLGQEVKSLQVGDRVMGLVLDSFSQYGTVKASSVVPIPDGLTWEEAATIPGGFLTAYYALVVLGKLQPGERVLIHAATGGVGQAAVQIAQHIGAEVFATASPEKWPFLEKMGVKQIMNSRTLTFAQQIKETTAGQGVAVVLNCLSGEFIAKSLSVLSPQGRFIEIGKQEVLTPEQAAEIREDISYHCFDLLELAQCQPDVIQGILQKLVKEFQQKNFTPLPYQNFSAAKVKDGFRCLQQTKHIGKIVISQGFRCQKGSYLITGGLGDLGLCFAQWLGEKGAKWLILVGRQEASAQARQTLHQLESQGINILILSADVSSLAAVDKVLESGMEAGFPPIRGVIHAAGVLEDSTILQQQWPAFERVMAGKALGAWNLHRLTQKMPLDFFILCSSAASLLGSPGQISYGAANGFLDALAQARQGMGLPTLSINWGAWETSGMAARQTTPFGLKGMGKLKQQRALAILEKLLLQSIAQVGVMEMDWSDPIWVNRAFLADLTQNMETKASEKPKTAILDQLLTLPPKSRKEFLLDYVASQVKKVIGIESSSGMATDRPLFDLGIDSLTSIELKNQLQTDLNCSLTTGLIFDSSTVIELVDYLDKTLFSESQQSSDASANMTDKELEMVQQLSEEEAEALLIEKLNNLPL